MVRTNSGSAFFGQNFSEGMVHFCDAALIGATDVNVRLRRLPVLKRGGVSIFMGGAGWANAGRGVYAPDRAGLQSRGHCGANVPQSVVGVLGGGSVRLRF